MAITRADQLFSGRDLTQCRVLCPALFEACRQRVDVGSIIDIGCGVGYLTQLLSKLSPRVIGIDPSAESIRVARARNCSDAIFLCSDASEHIATLGRYDIAIANLVLMNMVDLREELSAIRGLLRPSGCFIFSITNPATWPRVCSYENQPWFEYNSEIFVEGPFRIANEPENTFNVWHAHRPLRLIIDSLQAEGFVLEELLEPFPVKTDENMFSYRWTFPRYLLIVARIIEKD